MIKSLYEIPPGCICLGDGLLGMRCPAPKHATKSAAAWEAAANAVENELRRKDCAHCGDRAGGHDGTIWCAECFQWWCKEYENQEHEIIIADNDRLRAVLEAQLSELMETYPCFGMGGGSRSEELAQDQWEKEHGRQKAFLRTALAPPAPDAVAKGGAV